MKKLVAAIILLTAMACSDSKKEENFLNTYKEILIARETIADTLRANQEVKKIMKRHNYTEKSFRDDFFSFASENEKMVRLMDSLRSNIQRESDSLTGGPEK